MKSKKFIVTTLAVAMACALTPSLKNTVSKANALSAADACFLDFVSSDIEGEVIYEAAPLYDETLAQSGYEYTFEADGQSGYALVHGVEIAGQTYYEVEEASFSSPSPFAACDGLPVYVTFRSYLEYENGAFYELTTGEAVSQEALAAAVEKGFGYHGGANFVEDSYTISYATKSTTSYSIPYDLPIYYPASAESSCANAAGGILIGYYDRFYENLIPDYQAYYSLGGVVVYKVPGQEITDLILDLYERMGTTNGGTTYSGFQAGMTSYVASKGYTYTTTDMFTNGAFDFTKYKSSIDAGKPVALFLDGYAIYTELQEGDGVDTVVSDVSTSTHVASACGYRCIAYFDTNGNEISTQRYLKISSGLSLYDICYLNMNAYGTINRAISVEIS